MDRAFLTRGIYLKRRNEGECLILMMVFNIFSHAYSPRDGLIFVYNDCENSFYYAGDSISG